MKRVMMDPGSAVNLLPISTAEALDKRKDLSSNCQKNTCRNGMVRLNCNVGPFKSPIEFQVVVAPYLL